MSHMTTNRKDANTDEVLLHKHGLKKTPSRLRLLQVLRRSHHPMTSAQILKILSRAKKAARTAFDRATLFRNLKTLSEAGIINSTDFGTGMTFYCLYDEEAHHHHVYCVQCETVKPLTVCVAAPMINQAEKLGFQVINHRMELMGLCSSCR